MHTSQTEDSQGPDMKKKKKEYKKSVSKKGNFQFCDVHVKKIDFKSKATPKKCVNRKKNANLKESDYKAKMNTRIMVKIREVLDELRTTNLVRSVKHRASMTYL